jgi:hypothetical protein
MNRYRFILGAIIMLGLMALAVAVAMGKVEEHSSYGLIPILGILGKVALDFSEWCFRQSAHRSDEETKPESGADVPKS